MWPSTAPKAPTYFDKLITTSAQSVCFHLKNAREYCCRKRQEDAEGRATLAHHDDDGEHECFGSFAAFAAFMNCWGGEQPEFPEQTFSTAVEPSI